MSCTEPVGTGVDGVNQLAVNFTLFSLLLDAHTSKFTVLNSVKDRKWVGEREDNPKSSISYNTEDRPDNWLKYLAAAELNNHFTIKGNQKMENDRRIEKRNFVQWKIGCCQWILNSLNIKHIAVSVFHKIVFHIIVIKLPKLL